MADVFEPRRTMSALVPAGAGGFGTVVSTKPCPPLASPEVPTI